MLFVRRMSTATQPKTQKMHINFDKKDLRQLTSGVERALQKSPSDPPVRLASLSYLPAEARRTGGTSALDGTPFCPSARQKSKARDSKYTLLTPENFDPKMFLAMDKVFLAAVVAKEVSKHGRRARFELHHRIEIRKPWQNKSTPGLHAVHVFPPPELPENAHPDHVFGRDNVAHPSTITLN